MIGKYIYQFGMYRITMFGFVFPMASALQSLGELERLRDIYVRAFRFVAALAGFVYVPLFVLGDSFLRLWTPSIIAQVAGVFRLLMLASYLGILTTPVVKMRGSWAGTDEAVHNQYCYSLGNTGRLVCATHSTARSGRRGMGAPPHL